MTQVTRWELMTFGANITKSNFATVTVDLSLLRTEKDKDGKTAWEKLQQLAADGWELVNVTPIVTASSLSYTSTLVYTFKRPMP